MATSAKSILYRLMTPACLVVSVAGLYNVYGDNSETEARAQEMLCPPGQACKLTGMSRTPFSQMYEFTSAKGASRVRCARSFVFFGPFDCHKES